MWNRSQIFITLSLALGTFTSACSPLAPSVLKSSFLNHPRGHGEEVGSSADSDPTDDKHHLLTPSEIVREEPIPAPPTVIAPVLQPASTPDIATQPADLADPIYPIPLRILIHEDTDPRDRNTPPSEAPVCLMLHDERSSAEPWAWLELKGPDLRELGTRGLVTRSVELNTSVEEKKPSTEVTSLDTDTIAEQIPITETKIVNLNHDESWNQKAQRIGKNLIGILEIRRPNRRMPIPLLDLSLAFTNAGQKVELTMTAGRGDKISEKRTQLSLLEPMLWKRLTLCKTPAIEPTEPVTPNEKELPPPVTE